MNFTPENPILADYVIPTPERRFISDQDLEDLHTIKDHHMDKDEFTIPIDGVPYVRLAQRSLVADSIQWDQILNKPIIPNVDELIHCSQDRHTHPNKDVLDMMNVDQNNLPIWNHKDWPYPTKGQILPLEDLCYRNICMDQDPPKEPHMGDLWFKVDDISKVILSINIFKDGTWYTMDVYELMIQLANQISHRTSTSPLHPIGEDEEVEENTIEWLVSQQVSKILDEKIFNEELICDGVTYRFLITHSFNTRKIMCQIIDASTGIEVDRKLYTLIRNTDNTVILTFYEPPIKDKKYDILLLKMDQ